MIRRHHGAGWLRRLVAALRVVPWPVLAAAAVGVIAALTLVVLGLRDRQQATEATQDLGATSRALDETEDVLQQTDAQRRSLAAQILYECGTGDLRGRICDDALDARTPVPAPPDRSVTLAELDAAVAEWLTAHPPVDGRPPTPAEVAAAVAAYLTANPPEPGRPPTADEVAAAVAMWFAANPPEQGEPGRPPTDEEIDAAVAEWFAEHPPPPAPACPDGFEPVETGEARGTDGTRYARSITCVDPDSAMPPPPTTDPPPTSDPPAPPATSPPVTAGPPG